MNKNANRGRVRPWRQHENDYLIANYATIDTKQIAEHLRRSVGGVYRHANMLGLKKPNYTKWTPGTQVGAEYRFKPGHSIGPRFQPGSTAGKAHWFRVGNVPHNKGTGTKKEPKRIAKPPKPIKEPTVKLCIWERCAALFDRYKELKQKDMQRILGLRSGSVSNALQTRPHGLFYIDRWVQVNRNFEAVYVAGNGYDAERPNKEEERQRERAIKIEKPDPIPHPVSWLWGVPTSTSYSPASPAERNAA